VPPTWSVFSQQEYVEALPADAMSVPSFPPMPAPNTRTSTLAVPAPHFVTPSVIRRVKTRLGSLPVGAA